MSTVNALHVFLTMQADPEWTGIGGYLKASNRNRETDIRLLDAAFALGLKYSDLFLWCNSRYARHFMDANQTSFQDFIKELRIAIPALKEEGV